MLMEASQDNSLPLSFAQNWEDYRSVISDSEDRQIVPAPETK